MTSDTDIHDKLRAVFLAAIMVVSMAAVGATFAGSAAADTPAEDLANEEILIGQELTVDVSDNASNGDVVQVRQGILGDDESERVAAATVEDGNVTFSQSQTGDFEEDFHYLRTGGEPIDGTQFTVAEKDLEADFEPDAVSENRLDVAELSISSDNWADSEFRDDNFSVTVMSEDFDQDDLLDIFPDAEEFEDDGIQFTDINESADFDAEFSAVDADTGEYDFDVSSLDASAEETATVEIVEAVDADIEFAEGIFTEQNGDIVSIELDVEGTERVQLTIGQDGDDFQATLDLDEIDTDDEVVVDVNTYLLGYAGNFSGVNASTDDAFSVENAELNVTSFDAAVSGGPNASMVSEARYRLDAQPFDEVADEFDRGGAERANLEIVERETVSLNTWTAPWGAVGDLESLEDVGDAVEDGLVTEADTLTDGDALIFEIDANGLEGMIAFADEVEGTDDSLANAINISHLDLSVEETDVPRNVEGVSFSYDDSDFENASIIQGSEDAYFAAFELNDSAVDRDFNNLGDMEATFGVDGSAIDDGEVSTSSWGLVPPGVEDNTETVNASFSLEEPELDYNTDEDDQYVRQNAADQEIDGTTNLAPGNEFLVLADGPTVTSETVTVDEEGWSASLDFSGAADEDTYNLEIEDDERVDEVTQDAILIQEEDVAEANFQVSSDDATATPGEELEIEVDVENTGDEEDTQNITFSVEGEEVDSQELTLEGGEEETLTFEYTAPEEEGDYEWTVASDDDEATYTLTVEDDVAEANFEIVDVTPGEDMTVEPGEALTIDAEIENTGDEEATQDVVFNFDGADLVDEELTLDGGESDSVTFNVDAPDDEGDYAWFVATDDDESATWTLTVEADEPADTDDTDDTDDVDETDDTDDTDDADDDGAGFGVIVAALALLGAALLAIRRQVQLE